MWNIFEGDCLDLLRDLPDECIDSIVTDPPYELGFMNKRWDASGVAYKVEVWREALRVLKPGGHLLAFGGTRTYHRMVCAIEDAGFDVRDSIHWIYGSGFPKSLDVSKGIDRAAGAERKVLGRVAGMGKQNPEWNGTAQGRAENSFKPEYDLTAPATDAAKRWQGWGTALKPAHEPIVVARKPLDGTVAANVLEHGTGALYIDGTRVEYANAEDYAKLAAGVQGIKERGGVMGNSWKNSSDLSGANDASTIGRWPPNILLTHDEDCGDECVAGCPVAKMDTQSGISKSTGGRIGNASGCYTNLGSTGWSGKHKKGDPGYGDSGGASRYFPCFYYGTKASRKERERGCENLPARSGAEAVEREEGSDGLNSPRAGAGRTAKAVRNHHPTVKPEALMQWLVRLVTPPGGTVLDPFTGSGTTGVAAVYEGFNFVGFEQSAEYVTIAEARIAYADRNKEKP